MIDISVKNLIKSFEVGSNLLDGLSFEVNSGERVGILGRNGCGKTTLFRILVGEIDYDEGQIMVAPGKRMGLMSQIPVYPPDYTTEDVLMEAHRPLYVLQRQMEELSVRMAEDHSESVLKEYDRVSAEFEARGGYSMDVERARVANGLEISEEMRAQSFDRLSGGEKTRVNLARLILEDTDILLLDEPTNHLDLRATEWLEEYLAKFRGTVLAISHDRWFLDRVIHRAVEISDGKAELYSGNYSFYMLEKQRRFEERMKQYEKEQAKIAQLEKSAEQLRLWAFQGMDKTYRRAKSMEKRIERMRTMDKPKTEKRLKVKFSERAFCGDEVLSIENVTKSFGERTLFSDLELLVTGGERIGIIGDNGTGKSTLVKLIMGEDFPDKGIIRRGPTVKTAYLPQVVEFDAPERSLYDTMLYSEKCTPQEARDRLAAFGFQGEDVFKSVSSLSGGERSRLRLCMLMRSEINLLILDEPTNHLDIASREWIEDAVEDYQEALLFVSHDRYFIQEFATRIWAIEDGKIIDFDGGFNAYREYRARQQALEQTAKTVEKKKEKAPKKKNAGSREKQLVKLEREIEKAEAAVAALDAQLEEFATDYEKLMELGREREDAETALNGLYEAWEELAEE
ncbi:MAG: ribosomal protection-like ABC-F family protein [Candidatus Heteroscillospira sp.]|jgi:ATP-binding cassette subfamily F protein 3